jgi:hypothetical protein
MEVWLRERAPVPLKKDERLGLVAYYRTDRNRSKNRERKISYRS